MRILRGVPFLILGFLAAAAADAQVVPLSRCRAAIPCSIPFGIGYRPDPLIAGQYGGPSNTALVVSVPLALPPVPRIEKGRTPDIGAALEEAIRQSVQTHPPRKDNTAAPTPALESEQPAPNRPIPNPPTPR